MERKKRLQLSKHRRAVAKCARLAQRRMSLQQHQPATWSFWILSISPFSNLNLLTTLNGKKANLFELLNENLAPHVSYYLRFATHWVRAILWHCVLPLQTFFSTKNVQKLPLKFSETFFFDGNYGGSIGSGWTIAITNHKQLQRRVQTERAQGEQSIFKSLCILDKLAKKKEKPHQKLDPTTSVSSLLIYLASYPSA